MTDNITSKGWQDGELVIIPDYCATLELSDNIIPIYIYVKNIKTFNCPYYLTIGEDVRKKMSSYDGRLKVRCLLHNDDLMIINNDKAG